MRKTTERIENELNEVRGVYDELCKKMIEANENEQYDDAKFFKICAIGVNKYIETLSSRLIVSRL